ncbi:MAG TPA: hypothetical protein VMN79_04605 [Casimicrobiaceae bacterium]|nr:hypothetical protein [Casimicrobiaceae bacterium]
MNVLRYRRVVATVCAIAFAILASVAASHLHIGADQDEACAVCAAFAGKLESPVAQPPALAPVALAFWRCEVPQDAQVRHRLVVILPPSCGPPEVA